LKKPNNKDIQAEKRSKHDINSKRGSGAIAIASRYSSDSERDESAESEESSDYSNGEDAALDFCDRNDDVATGDIIEDDNAAGSFNEVANSLGVNGHGLSPSSDLTDNASNKSAGAGHCVQGEASNDDAHLTKNPDAELESARAFYKSQNIAILKDMCITREITVNPSVGSRCIKEDHVNALWRTMQPAVLCPSYHHLWPTTVRHTVACPLQYAGLCNLEAHVIPWNEEKYLNPTSIVVCKEMFN
jgi:hypothetical protein